MDNEGLIAALRNKPGLRLGVMGGCFDPIHIAHLVAAEEALALFELDQVVFMPAGNTPHKGRPVAPAEFRYLLVAVATANNPRFSVSRFEVDRQEVCYTVDTLEYLASVTPPDTRMFFITGADAVLDILSWKNPGRLLELATFIAATRPGYDLSRLSGLLSELTRRAPGVAVEERVKVMEIPALAISSSMVRERLAAGKPVKYLVPEVVAELIEKSGFYSRQQDHGFQGLPKATSPQG